MRQKIFTIFYFILVNTSFYSCKKYLDEKPILSLTTPSSLNDVQVLLDNNSRTNGSSTKFNELLSDNYYVATSDWQLYLSASSSSPALAEECLNYIWDKNAPTLSGWESPYKASVYYSNIALDILPTIPVSESNKELWNNLKGTALFYRGFIFERLAQTYCKPYSSSAQSDPGIVLKLTSNINEKIARSTVRKTYDRIITDLKEAVDLLPSEVSFPTRPSKAAAYAALARIYLSMRDYSSAGIYADLCLKLKDTLMDYNKLVPVSNPPIKVFNPEVLFHSRPAPASLLGNSIAKIDSFLYQSYSDKDLRKTVFFKVNANKTYGFQGSYFGTANGNVFDGLTTAEVYLIRAECYARSGNVESAMKDLNKLMQKRWKNDGSWVPFTASGSEDAKQKILMERRKELLYRGLRWSDLRRLNLEGANITLTRIINGTTYTLAPNDLRWVLLIPQEVVNFSAIEQNPR